MREETSEQPTNFTHDVIVEDRFIGRIDLTPLIVGTVKIVVKPRASVRNGTRRASTLVAFCRGAYPVPMGVVCQPACARIIGILDAR
jgi:hypothetical protein